MNDSAELWARQECVLPYRLGEITLFSARFEGLVLKRHYLDLLPDPDVPPPPLARLGDGVDVVVTRSHPIAASLPMFSRRNDSIRYVTAQYRRYHTDMTGSFESYLAKFNPKTRSTLKRKVRKFMEQPEGARFEVFRSEPEIAQFHPLARKVSALTYQERLLDSGLPDDAESREEMMTLARQDRARAYLLFLGGEPVAYLYCPTDAGILFYDHLGYDPRFSQLSPGTVLQFLAFESLFAEQRFRAFDFTEGEGPHKALFSTHETPCADIWYFRPTLGHRVGTWCHSSLDRLSSGLGRALERLQLKSVVRRAIRKIHTAH